MTDKQSKRDELLTRLDELDRLKALTTDPKLTALIEERKTALRQELDNL